MSTHDLSCHRVLLFGAFGNGNLGDTYQALAVRHHLLGMGMRDENIFACSRLDSHEYPFPETRKLPASYLTRTEELNSRFSALLIGGGGLLAHAHDPLPDAVWAQRVRIPVMLLSIGANDEWARRSAGLLDTALVISGRDGPSLESLRHSTGREPFLLRDPILCLGDTAPLLELDPPINTIEADAGPIDVLWILKSPVNAEESRLIEFVRNYIHSDTRRHAVVVTEPALDANLAEQMPGIRIHQPANLRAFLSFIERAGRIFSMRYHGVIFAALAGKLAYGLSQKRKVECLYSECGLPGCYVNGLDQLASLLVEKRNERRISSRLVRARNVVRLEFLDSARVVEKAFSDVRLPQRVRDLDSQVERNQAAYHRAVMNRHGGALESPQGKCSLEQAIEAGLRLAHVETGRVEDWVALAHLLARAGRLDESLVWISRSVALAPDVAEYHRLRASLLERLERFEAALQAASRALELDPADSELLADVGRIGAIYSSLLRKERDSASDLRAAIDTGARLALRQPEGIEDWIALAQLLARAERLEEALSWVERAISKHSTVAEYHRLRASLLERVGLYAKAHEAARQACGLEPGNLALVQDVKRTRRKLALRIVGLSRLAQRN